MRGDTNLGPVDPQLAVKEVAEQGYTIVEDAIEPDFVDALATDLRRLEEYFEVREVTDRAVVADDGFEHARAVQHRAVLHRRARTDHDAALVAAQHGLGPDRGTGADHDVADDRRLLVHERLGIDLRFDVAERIQSHERRH